MSNLSTEPPFILIVEDSEDDFEAMTQAFQKVPISSPFLRCRNGREALDYLKQEGLFQGTGKAERPGLILLDLNMPGIDGRKVLQFIKGDERFKSIPVVIFTTSGSKGDISACYKSGANAYVQKPTAFEEMVQALRKFNGFWFETARLSDDGSGISPGKP